MSALSYLVSTFIWGILFGVLFTALTLYIISKSTNASKCLTMIQGAILLFFLSFQFSALIGAYKVKKYVENIIVPVESIEKAQSLDNIKNESPLLPLFLKGIETKIDSRTNGTLVTALLHRTINHYIYRRIGWIAGGIIFLFLASLLFAESPCMKWKQTRRHVRNRSFPHTHRRKI